MTIAIFLSSLIAAMMIGVPISFSLLLCGAALMWHLNMFDAQILAQNLIEGSNSFPLLAVPFFMLAGEIMNAGGLSKRIVMFAMSLVGHVRGGLGYVAIGAAVLMASMSGSALADTAALATILLPMMRQQGYPMNTSAGLIASGGIIAPIIPPSMPFVIYGVTTNTSISALFVSGIVPGLMMGVGLIFAWRWVLKDLDLPQGEPLPLKERLRATARAFWALLMPIIIIGGMKSGVFTPTEAAVVATVYALVVALVVHREMNLGQLAMLLRAEFLVDAVGYNRVRGAPFKASELQDAITALAHELGFDLVPALLLLGGRVAAELGELQVHQLRRHTRPVRVALAFRARSICPASVISSPAR